jgi:hypothetical protein
MKKVVLSFMIMSFSISAQVKKELIFNLLQKVENTDFYVSSFENQSKFALNEQENNQVLIINSKSNEVKNIVFPLNENINKVFTDCKSLFKNSNFILVETSFENEKSGKVWSNFSRNLYLIELKNCSLIKLNNDLSTTIEYKISEENSKLILIEKSVLKSNENQAVIVILDLKTGDKNEIYKIN